MYRIAVCDDEKLFAESLSHSIKAYMDTQQLAYCVDVFYSVSALNLAMNRKQYDLLFLDILVREASGMTFAKALRERGDSVNIVFVSSNTDYAMEAYSVFPITFLSKPVSRADVETVLEKMLSSFLRKPTLIVNDKGNGRTAVQYDSICYVESMGHDILIQCCNKETLCFSGVFSEFAVTLPESSFFRCHRSYAVNFRYVRRMHNYRFIMEDGSMIPIAKPLYRLAQERFASAFE